MSWNLRALRWKWIRIFAGILLFTTGAITFPIWWPSLSDWVDRTLVHHRAGTEGLNSENDPHRDAGGTVQSELSHGLHQVTQPTAASLELTSQARSNLGLTPEYLRPIELRTFRRMINVPAAVIARPGRTEIQVASPLNGVITHVHSVTGEAVLPGELLFEIRLSYEDLVESQTAFLKTLGELEVENREIERLEVVTQSGAVSGKTLLERRYAKDKLEALIRSQREGLKVHGLSERQVDSIATEGKLLRDLKVVVPEIDRHSENEELRLSSRIVRPVAFQNEPITKVDSNHSLNPLTIATLNVRKGQAVMAGEPLCSLVDLKQLFIEGQAFEQDGSAIGRATGNNWTVEAVFPDAESEVVVRDLKLAFVGNSVDRTTRTLPFYIELPNQILRDERSTSGQRFITWKFRPGQRLEVRVPVEEWLDQIVVPIDAVVKEGADWFVFQQNGKRFDRVPVHVRYRDQIVAVIANDGSIYPGDVIAFRAAHQMQMAIKNKSGAAADLHAGHSH
ncbi:MAG: efflux RND transporter periplasmic adaptor subunit [Pirellulaceae bacterium]|nr:efflux RND transporter periplasmic adaptor subunit [Pirellulaceae bacterium]